MLSLRIDCRRKYSLYQPPTQYSKTLVWWVAVLQGKENFFYKDFILFLFSAFFQNVYCPRNPVQAQLGGRCEYLIFHFVWFCKLDICWTVLWSPCIHKENGVINQPLLGISPASLFLIALTVTHSFIWNKCHGAKTLFGIEWDLDSIIEKEMAGTVFCQIYYMSGDFCLGDICVFNVKPWAFIYRKLQLRILQLELSTNSSSVF